MASEIPQGVDPGDVFRVDRDTELRADQLDEGDGVHRRNAGVAESKIEIRLATGVKVVAIELQQAVGSR